MCISEVSYIKGTNGMQEAIVSSAVIISIYFIVTPAIAVVLLSWFILSF